jgi:beta-lactamase regulating signal transducer with metallopeptidase domain
VALCGWLAGVWFFGARLIWTNWRFRARLGQYRPVRDETARRLLDECRATFGLGRAVGLIESEEVESPAVYGLWRKWLLLPEGVCERFSPAELRCIFLHELAHIKRLDLGVNWLVALLQVLHWFNPVLWLAWARMQADRELATDALALAHLPERDHVPYGETILKVLDSFTGQGRLPGLVGILENKAQLKERLVAISRPGKHWKWATLAAVALIAGLGLTGAQLPHEFANSEDSSSKENVKAGGQSAASPNDASASDASSSDAQLQNGVPALHLEGTVVPDRFEMDGSESAVPTNQIYTPIFTASVSGCAWTVRLGGLGWDTNLPASITDISCDGTNVYFCIQNTDGHRWTGNSWAPVTQDVSVYPGRVKIFHGIMGAIWWGYCSSGVIAGTTGPVPDVLNLSGFNETWPDNGRLFARFDDSRRLPRYFGPVRATLYNHNPSDRSRWVRVIRTLAEIEPIGICERNGLTVVTNYVVTSYYPQTSSDSKLYPFERLVVTINTFYPETNAVSFIPKITGLASIEDHREPGFGDYFADHWLTADERLSPSKSLVVPHRPGVPGH